MPNTSRKSLRSFGAKLLIILVLLAVQPMPLAHAFVPTNLKAFLLTSPFDQTHQSITTDAIKEVDNEFFGITNLTKPMKKAIEEIADADAEVDQDQVTSAKHFDGESLPEGQARVVALLSEVRTALSSNNASGARSKLGQALHTIQDFYSHSNWIELGNAGPNPSLGRPGSPLNRLAPNIPTCVDCTPCFSCTNNITTSSLTSGYYGGEDRVKPNAQKCSHGGPLDGSATGLLGSGINKDSEICGVSPHSGLHFAAAAAAKEATKQFIRDIKALVTPRELKLLLGVGPNLAIAMDTTGSMGSIISGVKQQAIQIVDARLDTDEEPSKYVLAAFNDPSVGPTTVTTDADAFKSSINALFASAGDDCPELSMNGMLLALAASDKGGDLFMFTDASSKDGSLAGAVSSLASSKDIKVFPITFGSCSPLDPGYIRIANESGGQVFELLRSEAGAITQLADFIVRSNAVDVLSVGDVLAGDRTYAVPVDTTMNRVTFSVSGLTAVTLRRPDGSAVLGTEEGVRRVTLSTGVLYSIVDPVAGEWTVTLGGNGTFSLNVSGESVLDLDSFRFVAAGGRPAHEGYFPIPGLPLAGQVTRVDALLSGGFRTAEFEMRSKDGSVLGPLSLSRGTGVTENDFSADVTLPAVPFLVYVRGQDPEGLPYQRVRPASVRPQTVVISVPPSQDLRPGLSTSYTFTVTNLGPVDGFHFTGADDQGYLSGISPATFTLGSGESREVTVSLTPPDSALPGTSDTLTVNVQGDAGSLNFAVVESTVAVGNQPPDCNSARADVTALWPPDHAMHPVSILGVTDPDGDAVTVSIDQILQDEPVLGQGSGDTCPDGQGLGVSVSSLRAERSGTGNGRVYRLSFTASDGKGGSCRGAADVCVPHNQKDTCTLDGTLIDSTSCR